MSENFTEDFLKAPSDKQCRFLTGAKIYSKCYLFMWKLLIIVVILAGLSKELIDLLDYGTPEVEDFKWTVCGAIVLKRLNSDYSKFKEVYEIRNSF